MREEEVELATHEKAASAETHVFGARDMQPCMRWRLPLHCTEYPAACNGACPAPYMTGRAGLRNRKPVGGQQRGITGKMRCAGGDNAAEHTQAQLDRRPDYNPMAAAGRGGCPLINTALPTKSPAAQHTTTPDRSAPTAVCGMSFHVASTDTHKAQMQPRTQNTGGKPFNAHSVCRLYFPIWYWPACHLVPRPLSGPRSSGLHNR